MEYGHSFFIPLTKAGKSWKSIMEEGIKTEESERIKIEERKESERIKIKRKEYEVIKQKNNQMQSKNGKCRQTYTRKNAAQKENVREQGFEYVKRELPEITKDCRFGDEYFFYEEEVGKPKYEDMNEKWNIFAQWIEDVREKCLEKEGFVDSYPDRVGHEVAKWARRHDFYVISQITMLHWEIFRDTYLLVDGCPELVLEFMQGIMYEKMTEKQMWGPKEEQRLKGKLILFREEYLPQEGEDTGDLEIIYEPIVPPPGGEDMEDDICPFEFYPREEGLFPKIPLFWET